LFFLCGCSNARHEQSLVAESAVVYSAVRALGVYFRFILRDITEI